jgi:hypothetical protein
MTSVFSPIKEMTAEEFKRRGIPLQAAYCGAKQRDPGICRFAPLRVAVRAEQRAGDHGADAGIEYASVFSGKKSLAEKTTTGAADFSTRNRSRSDLLGGAS